VRTAIIVCGLGLAAVLLSQPVRWVYRYDGATGVDQSYSIVRGGDGNVYVAGESYSAEHRYDFVVLSLTQDGNRRWVCRLSGSNHGGWDRASSLAYGADGNIYAAGRLDDSTADFDFVVASLAPDGNVRWVYEYPGALSYDEAFAVAYGADGNIYAAGMIWGSAEWDFTVISLNAQTGSPRWVYQYDGPLHGMDRAYALVCGGDSNVYVAGSSQGTNTSEDLTVISLTPAGGERWIYRYDGVGHYNDEARSLGWGSDGNVYAAGSSFEGANGRDLTVVSLTPEGTERWVHHFNGPGNYDDEARALACGPTGKVYVAGTSLGSGSGKDFVVLSLSQLGAQGWVYRYNGPANYDDEASSVVCGSDGGVYAAGASLGQLTEQDLTVVGLDTATGNERWVYRYDGPVNREDRASAIAFGADGHVYAAGSSMGPGTGVDITVVKLYPATGCEQESNAGRERAWLYPTVVGPELYLAEGKQLPLLDAAGRTVAELGYGVNDLRHLANGIYFCRLRAGGETRTRKLVLQR
jgi:uncharacterized delta-60 repeat protein